MNEQILSSAEIARRERIARKAKKRAQMEALKVDPNAERIPYKVLLYYKYVPIADPKAWSNNHLKWCKENNVKGRILVSNLGINGTCAGPAELMEKYKEHLWADPLFKDMVFKESDGDQFTFTKLYVRVKDELVTLRVEGITVENGGQHIPPEEFDRMIENDPDVVLVDMRNKYEWDIGRFENAIPLEMKSFRELPEAVDKIEHLKGKKILAYCTGGVRCETGTAYLKARGFKDVYQLEGGIHTYGLKSPDKHWEGKMFVFDRRVSMPINKEKDQIISVCKHCDTKTDIYVNCSNKKCNQLFICCENCGEKMKYTCGQVCYEVQSNLEVEDLSPLLQKQYQSQRINSGLSVNM